MQIKRLVIENFKSIEQIELIEPNPFTVFVGPNGSGKSNIFEALEFMNLASKAGGLVDNMFGGSEKFLNRRANKKDVSLLAVLDYATLRLEKSSDAVNTYRVSQHQITFENDQDIQVRKQNIEQFVLNFTRLFVGNADLVRFTKTDSEQLSLTASNLEPVLKRILTNDILKREIFEWLELFVPSFRAVEVDDRDELHWFEESSSRYFTKDLISDGTKSILALLTAVYQSDDNPQFLCIEEPENGLHPKVARELMDFFRLMCEERGHYIWVNTHSPYMASRVKPEELVTVNKVDGSTQIKQFKGMNWHGLTADEAWLSNVLGGGNPW